MVFGFAGRRRARRAAILVVLSIIVLMVVLGCGGGGASLPPTHSSFGTPPGTYNVNVTAAGGGMSHSQVVQVVVN